MRKLVYLIVVIVALGLIVAGCIPVVPPSEQNNTDNLTKDVINVTSEGSIQAAIDAAAPGDTIEVAAGTYPEEIIVNVEGLTIKGESLDAIVNGGFLLLADNITIDGLTIINGYNNRAINTQIDVNTSSKDHKITNNDISGIKWAINIAACGIEPVNILVDNNKIHDCRIAIMLEGYRTTITNNEFYDNTKSGIEVEQSCDNEISYNSIYNNGQFGIRFCKDETTGNVVNRNSIYDNYVYGVLNDSNDDNPSPVDATCNWWGNASGPYHSTNTSGTGNAVSDNVEFRPWMSSPGGFCGIEIAVDIKPQSCPNPLNVKSKGVLPVAILGTENFDVNNIDPNTVLLEGVLPVKWAFEDVATYEPIERIDCYDCSSASSDEILDLILHFNTQKIVLALGDIEDGACVALTLTGNLLDETPIEGEASVLIIKKGKP